MLLSDLLYFHAQQDTLVLLLLQGPLWDLAG